ncbi:hypothetical protein AVEN_206577-1 [Araneus ventricosus]|uniref:Uncharacterized protein n=1 Tax=Araneus ventricosus TaxID=182803 RepID=A0A4Y2QNU7_ARAVE|nr:hypothetical protein AVEN_206577-1 [Araneus ventricosus]
MQILISRNEQDEPYWVSIRHVRVESSQHVSQYWAVAFLLLYFLRMQILISRNEQDEPYCFSTCESRDDKILAAISQNLRYLRSEPPNIPPHKVKCCG